jgi:hypothetical protein
VSEKLLPVQEQDERNGREDDYKHEQSDEKPHLLLVR